MPCGTCSIPTVNLMVAWTNVIIGNGSTNLFYNGGVLGAGQWGSNCTNQLIYSLSCNVNLVEFRVYYFVSGTCPTGMSNYCSNLAGGAGSLIQTSLTCGASFMAVYSANCVVPSCPVLCANGYGTFTITV